MASPQTSRKAYRLRGVVAGAERTFSLAFREHRVGRTAACDIRLSLEGVSREHAVLRVKPEGLEVEDLGSSNGTFVDGRRVQRALVPPGTELGFGPARLAVETTTADDVEIGLAIDPGGPPASGPKMPGDGDSTRITDVGKAAETTVRLALIEGFVERLACDPRPDLTGALAFLVEKLAALGGCVAEWTADEDPIVLAATGNLYELPSHRQIRHPDVALESSGADLRTEFLDTMPALSLAVHSRSRHETRGLMLWGDFAGRPGSVALLRTLVRLVDLIDTRPAADGGSSAATSPQPCGGLVFPPGYHVGSSPAAVAMHRQLQQVARSDLQILIVGETGAGKERVARILHASFEDRQGPFVPVNCAAIPSEMLEAEMFGIGKGVATGVTQRSGKFQLAEGGTLFLDEISEMPPPLQAKLLRALEDREIQPVGGRPQRVDVRLIAASNADLMQLMEKGIFRRDLFYRLAGHRIEVPPLRSLQEDIPGFVQHFLRIFSSRAGTRIRGMTARTLRLLTTYSWPGNIRELEHEMHRLVDSSADGQVIDSGMLAARFHDPPRSRAASLPELGGDSLNLGARLEELEARLIREALKLSDGKQIEAARRLGISRNGLAKKMKRLGIEV